MDSPSPPLDPLLLLAARLQRESSSGRAFPALLDSCREPPLPLSLPTLLAAAERLAATMHRVLEAQRTRSAEPTSNASSSLTDEQADPPFVGVMVREGPMVVLGPLAAMLGGFAFVLLDPCLPRERLKFQLEDTGAALLLVPSSSPGCGGSGASSPPSFTAADGGDYVLGSAGTAEQTTGQSEDGEQGDRVEAGWVTLYVSVDEYLQEWEDVAGHIDGNELANGAADTPDTRELGPIGTYTLGKTDSARDAPISAEGPTSLLLALLSSAAQPARLAYVCYTSGSTGQPKGCAVERLSLAAYAVANASAHDVTIGDRVLLASGVGFDPIIGEAWTSLAAGATLCLPHQDAIRGALAETLWKVQATHVTTTPALWATVPLPSDAPPLPPSLRCVALGGEAMPPPLLTCWAPKVPLFNIYGVTECTVYQASRRVASAAQGGHADAAVEARLVGKPLEGCELLLLDKNWKEIPPPATGPPTATSSGFADGITPNGSAHMSNLGQLAISGRQLARGYWRLPDRTAAAFVWLPPDGTEVDDGSGTTAVGVVEDSTHSAFRRLRPPKDWRRVYLTGDLAKWSDDGRWLVLCGRSDRQVKLSGVRIELDEVESVLASSSLVMYAAAIILTAESVAGEKKAVDHSSMAVVEEQGPSVCTNAPSPARGSRGHDTTASNLMSLVPPSISSSVPMARLVCAVAPRNPCLSTSPELSAATSALLQLHCHRWLLPAARPARILVLEELPLTPTGKIDRLALPPILCRAMADVEAREAASGEPPRTPLERLVAEVWAEILSLRVKAISRHASFQHLGGDSIKALQVCRILSLRLSHVYELPTLHKGRWGQSAESPDSADFGTLHGPFAAWRLVRLPLLHQYCAYLESMNVEVAGSGTGTAEEDALGHGLSAPMAADATAGGVVSAHDAAAKGAKVPQDPESWDEALNGREEEAASSAEIGALVELQSLVSGAGGVAAESALLQRVLYVGARHGCIDLIKAAMHLGAEVSPRHPRPRPMRGSGQLHALAEDEDAASIAVLAPAGLPPLHAAAHAGHAAAVSYMLSAGGRVTALTASGDPLLHVACESPLGLPVLAELLAAGTPIAMRDGRRQTALHAAARVGAVDAISALLAAAARHGGYSGKEPYIELRDRWHRTALHWAVVNGQLGAADVLIRAGAAVNGVRSASKGKPMPLTKHLKNTTLPLECPLHTAARLPAVKAKPMIRLLLEANADPNALDQFKRTPMDLMEPAVLSAVMPQGKPPSQC